jgi:hypothetical protein
MNKVLPLVLRLRRRVCTFFLSATAACFAGGIWVYRLVADGEDFSQTFLGLTVWVLTANVYFAAD